MVLTQSQKVELGMLNRKQPATRSIGKKLYELVETFDYYYFEKNELVKITVPKRFTFDNASIPPWAWSPLGLYPGGHMTKPSLIHDFLYKNSGRIGANLQKKSGNIWVRYEKLFTRTEVDLLFLQMQKENGVIWWRRRVTFFFVTKFGAKHFNR